MQGYTVYIWVGVGLLIVPFLGIPGSWKETITALTALFLVGYVLWQHRLRQNQKETEAPPGPVSAPTEVR